MGEVSRGADYQLRLFAEGSPVRVVQPNNMTFGLEQTRERQLRCGTKTEPVRQTLHGHQGTATFEREDFTLDELEEMLIQKYLDGEKILKIDIIKTVYTPETGASQSWVYPNAAFSFTENVSGKNDAVTIDLEWQSELKKPL